jgi:hypothetical protein
MKLEINVDPRTVLGSRAKVLSSFVPNQPIVLEQNIPTRAIPRIVVTITVANHRLLITYIKQQAKGTKPYTYYP